jgi:hypothetical protein
VSTQAGFQLGIQAKAYLYSLSIINHKYLFPEFDSLNSSPCTNTSVPKVANSVPGIGVGAAL